MASYVFACTPLHGHLTPLLGIAAEAVRRSHQVTVLTGARFAAEVAAVGAAHVALPAGADYDDRDLVGVFAGGRPAGRIARVNADIERLLAAPLGDQHRALGRLVADVSPAAVLADTSFLGALTWRAGQAAAGGPTPCPLVVASVTFLTVRGRCVPPAGVGMRPRGGPLGAARDAAVRTVSERVLTRRGLAALDRASAAVGGEGIPGLLFDGALVADRLLVLTVPGFEYPRTDLPDRVRFTGPVRPPPVRSWDPPPWWPDLGADRPVVHVTQGTMDNADLGRLVGPALRALADEPVVVVATTGGPPASAVPGLVPGNARVAPYLPYSQLLPLVDVMVTNGGYGGVQLALAAGVPVAVAGRGEDKPEVAARVAWSGAGLDLHTGRPRPAAIRRAVRRLLDEPRFRQQARQLAGEMARADGARAAVDALEELGTQPPRRPQRR